MNITQKQYDGILANIQVPHPLKIRLQKEVIPVDWVFVGTDFAGQ